MKGRAAALRTALAGCCLILLAACLLFAAGCGRGADAEAEQLQVHFLDVGQADAALLQYKGQHMLIDTGDVDGRPALVQRLKEKGVHTLDVVLISHPHGDHLGGMAALFDQFHIKQIYDNGQESRTAMYKNYMKNIARKKISYKALKRGDKIAFAGDVVCYVLWPSADGAAEDAVSESGQTNNQSVVCKVSFGRFSVLFTGDAQRETEEQLLRHVRRKDLQATILKAGHHGSKTSSSPAFIEAVKPDAAVISCGAGNSYGFPHKAVLVALKKQKADIYRTDRDGDISVVSDGQGYTVTKER